MESVDLLEILYALRKRLSFIIMITIISILIAGIYSFIIAKPVYESTVRMVVYKDNGDSDNTSVTYNDIMLNNMLVKDYRELVMSKSVLNKVLEELKDEESDSFYTEATPKDLEKLITITIKQDTRWLYISVKNTHPERAMKIANKVADIFAERVQEVFNVNNVTIVDPAEEAENPVSPNKKLNLALGGIIGLVLGCGIAFAVEFFDNRIRYPEDLMKKYDIPIIGAIPQINDMDEEEFAQKGNKYILAETSKVFEAYRSARTNVLFANVDNPYKTILITSSIPGEGKTSFSSNLAMAFARAGHKTILVDIDLRRPRAHRAFRINTVKGLTSILAADVDFDRVVQRNVYENLDILPAGIRPPNPAELLGSNAMQNLLKKLEENYDIVILDSPPVGVFTDAAVVSGKVDGAIYVVAMGVAGHPELSRGLDSLKKVNTNIIGFAMLRVETDAKGRNYYNYKYNYYYGYSEKK